MEKITLERTDAHLRALEAAFIALAKLRLHEGRAEFLVDFDRNVDSISKAFATMGRTPEWQESLLKHRDVLKELIS